MSEVTLVPNNNDNSSGGFIALVLVVLVGLVLVGIFAFTQGWITTGTTSPDNSIDLTLPSQEPRPIETTSEAGFEY